MKRVPYFVLSVFLLATAAVAQENQRAPDRWAGMVLNVSTPGDVLRLLFEPSRTTDVECTHRELGSRLADRLCGDNADGLTDLNRVTRRQITAVTFYADAASAFAGEC